MREFQFTLGKKQGKPMPHKVVFSISSGGPSKGLSNKFNVVQNIQVNATIERQDLIELNNNQFSSLCKEMGGSKEEIKVIANKSVVFSNNKLGFATSWTSTYPLHYPLRNWNYGIEFTHYFRSKYFKTTAKLGTFNKFIKMSYVNDYIAFKSNIIKNAGGKSKHLPEEYVGMISVCNMV